MIAHQVTSESSGKDNSGTVTEHVAALAALQSQKLASSFAAAYPIMRQQAVRSLRSILTR
jgi:hypothetical protein